MDMTEHVIRQAADRLSNAARTRVPCPPVRDLLGTTDVALAYQVQNVLAAERLATGARIVGRKVGLTSPVVQRQLGVDQPDFGVLFDDMGVPDGGLVDSGRLIAPRAEAEIAFVLSADLADFATMSTVDAPVNAGEYAAAASAVDYAVAALEIVDSRVSNWDIRITDTVADNASSGMYVLGTRPVALADFAAAEVTMSLTHNGVLAATGTGAACLGDPVNALAWLARTACALGSPLRAGDVVLSGALGAMVAVEPGSEVVAELSIGRVSATFAK
jgi:2-keto-4-pentenoate hydratase